MEEVFKVTKVYSNNEGESCFDEIFYPLKENGPIGFLSNAVKVKELFFRTVLPEYDYDFHQAPQKQYIILLDGEIEIETSLGEKRRFVAGDVLLVEDIEGKGHKTKNLIPVKRKSIFITFD